MDRAKPSTTSAECFELVGADGTVRARWNCGIDGEPEMVFLDRQGRTALRLHLDTDGSVALTILGNDGSLALDVGIWGNGNRGVDIRRIDGSPASEIGIGSDGFPSVITFHPSGRTAAQLGTNRSGGVGLVLQAERTEQRAEYALGGDGEGHVAFTDGHRNQRALVGVTNKGRGTLDVHTPDAGRGRREPDEVDRTLGALRRWLGRS